VIVVSVGGIGVRGPGLDDWAEAAAVLGGVRAYRRREPAPAKGGPLAASERRRATRLTREVAETARQAIAAAGVDAADLPTVFASASGDLPVIDRICRVLTEADRLVSPTDFHNSVHNAPAGYWAIATGGVQGSVSLSAYDDSFAAGLLEAATWVAVDGGDVLLVAYDAPAPEPLDASRPIDTPFAVAMLLHPADGASALAAVELDLVADPPETTLPDPELETLRRGNPAARCLPLLAAVARRAAEPVLLPAAGTKLTVRLRT
jgi:hypothetical protein